jgi:MFS family permease
MTSTLATTKRTLPVRYRVVAFMVAMAGVTYLDRVAIATLAPGIMRDLNLSKMEMSFVFSAFTLAYALFEIPTAWWGERIGTRKVLTRIVVWWSAFTMATGAAFNHSSLLILRFMFGAGEAGAWPNAARTFSRWIPAGERGTVQGIFFAGAHLAGGLTPLLVVWLSSYLHWRAVFAVLGAVGFVWAAAWWIWFRDEPSEHPSVSQDEARYILENRGGGGDHHHGGKMWIRLVSHRGVLALYVTYFANTYGFYFLITWLPAYLEQRRGFTPAELSLFAGLPLILSVAADLTGGFATDYMTRRFGVRFGRVAVGSSAYAVAAIAMFAATSAAEARTAAILIAVAAAASMFTLGASWATAIEIGRRNSGIVSAAMNTSGQVGGILSPIVLALIVERFDNWSLPLLVMAVLYTAAALAWLVIDPRKPLVEPR